MVHCPECGVEFVDLFDVEFEEVQKDGAFLATTKRFYAISCANCQYVIGTGAGGAI